MKDSATGRVFYSYDFKAGELDDVALASRGDGAVFFMRLDPADGPAFVQLTWSGEYGCQGQARTANITPVRGERGKLKALNGLGSDAEDAGVRFGPRGGGSCLTTEMRRMRVTVKAGRQSRTFRLDGACGEWNRDGASLPGVRIHPVDSNLTGPAWLALSARPSAGKGGREIRLTVRTGSRRLLRRNFVAVWDRTPARRVYEGTDAFWNYCINKLKQTYSYHGRLYCIRPGFTIQYVSLTR